MSQAPVLLEVDVDGDLSSHQSGCHQRVASPEPRYVSLQEVVVTGVGVMLPGCDTRVQLWNQLRDGESQLEIEFDPLDQVPRAVGRIGEFSASECLAGIDPRLYRNCHREQLLYLSSVIRAQKDAGLELSEMDKRRVGLFDGTSRGSFAYWHNLLQNQAKTPGSRLSVRNISAGMPGQAVGIAAAILGTQGPTYTFNGTCAAGAIAIGHAFREVQLGTVDVAFGTGHDAALVEPIFQMYRDAGLLSSEGLDPRLAIRPYTTHCMNAFGEGAVTVVLENAEYARRRGAEPLARIVGYGYGNGGEHPTDVDFTGDRPAQLVAALLKEGQVTLDQVDFVLGHGNGVRASDISELNYMKRLFGRRTKHVPLISTKPIYGHTLGASSALNVAAAALMLKNAHTIPTVGADPAATVHGFNHQERGGESKPLDSGLVVAYGIGGQNAVVAMRRVAS